VAGGGGVGGNCFFGYLWRYFLYVNKNKKKTLHIPKSVLFLLRQHQTNKTRWII
jgi:hypothetical protein